jgi:hypothetical protein
VPTIRDVAKLTGVAPIAVSCVIKDSNYVSKETRLRVEVTIKVLGSVAQYAGAQPALSANEDYGTKLLSTAVDWVRGYSLALADIGVGVKALYVLWGEYGMNPAPNSGRDSGCQALPNGNIVDQQLHCC